MKNLNKKLHLLAQSKKIVKIINSPVVLFFLLKDHWEFNKKIKLKKI